MPGTGPEAARERLVVDGHVHLHGCFDVPSFLDEAEANLVVVARALGLDPELPGVLLLTESAEDAAFRDLRSRAGEAGGSGWSFRHTAEPESLLALRAEAPRLILVAGRQVATAEGLEVLALGCDASFDDGRPLAETLAAVRECGALPAVPWGFGKWWLGRGRLVRTLVEREEPGRFFLGDNGGRPALSRGPRLFAVAERRGIRVLPGSDPLPFAAQSRRVGTFGFVLRVPLDLERPSARIKATLSDASTTVEPFGEGRRLLPFLRDQVAMQLHKRRRGAAS
jgi:hypothetical protein